MAFDPDLADRIRELVGGERGVTERPMFGGVGFLVHGNLAVTASREGGILVRVEPADTPKLLQRPHTRPFLTRGRELDGWLRVDPPGVRTQRQLAPWVGRGVAFARSLPPKR